MDDRIWSDEEKQAWLVEHGATPTHMVTFGPLYQVEVCVPPWEQPERRIARSAVDWGKHMSWVFDDNPPGRVRVVAAHHEANTLAVHPVVTPQPRLTSVADDVALPDMAGNPPRRVAFG